MIHIDIKRKSSIRILINLKFSSIFQHGVKSSCIISFFTIYVTVEFIAFLVGKIILGVIFPNVFSLVAHNKNYFKFFTLTYC